MKTKTLQDCVVVLLVSLLSIVTALPNVAPGGTATQSSVAVEASASRAIDGNKDPYFAGGSCTHTAPQADPWWRLTLPTVYKITAVGVTNRYEVPQRLDNAVILIGNSPDNNGNNNPKCADIPSIPAGQTRTFQCGGMEGLYVNIYLPGASRALTLCEVEVFADLSPNVAPSGTAAQSSLYSDAVASRAIDGNNNPYYHNRSCSCTNQQAEPWWRLTLPTVYSITAVSVTNRYALPKRLDNAVILIGNSPDDNGTRNPKCADIPSIPAGQTRTFMCGGMEGRFVTIYIPGPPQYLTLCEVEVYGEMLVPFLGGTVMGRSVALVQKKLCWSDALLYCRRAFWDLLSVRSPDEHLELQSLLGNASFPLSKHLWLGLRRYLRGDKWFWMSGEAMTYSALRTACVWQAASPCAGMETSSPYRWTDYPCDDHAHFVCLREPQDGANRVEFYSSRNALNQN